MDIFTIPGWESSKIGDKNAQDLFNTSTQRGSSRNLTAGKRKKKNKLKIPTRNAFQTDATHSKTSAPFKSKTKLTKASRLLRKKKNVTDNTIKTKKDHVARAPKKFETVVNRFNKRETKPLRKLNKTNGNEMNRGDIKLEEVPTDSNISKKQMKKNKLIALLRTAPTIKKNEHKSMLLKERMMEKLKASRFRYINEQIYNSEGRESQRYFKTDPDAFRAYHAGYRQQVSKWPLNPVDAMIKSIRKTSINNVIADLGCGEAKLAEQLSQTVHSFDLVALNERVVACDMSKVPLENESVDIAVFCLSLMGSNIKEYLFEANRILKTGGTLKIVEVESRFDTVEIFIEGLKRFGFTNTWKDLSHNLFYFLDFKKVSKCKSLQKLPTISLHPCLYKKR